MNRAQNAQSAAPGNYPQQQQGQGQQQQQMDGQEQQTG
jgi:hypothetical protein